MPGRILNMQRAGISEKDAIYHAAKPLQIPDSFSMEAYAPVARDQGNEGSCGGQSATELLYGVRNKYFHTMKYQTYDPTTLFSANDIYWRARNRMGDTSQDSGVDNRNLGMSIVKDGMCREESRPYSDTDWKTEPNEEQNEEATHNKLGAFHFVLTTREICEVLYSGYPLIIGLDLYSSFMDNDAANKGVIPMPKAGEAIEGGHDMTVWGYDLNMKIGNSKGALKLLNHWGTDWGTLGGPGKQRGWCWIAMDLVERSHFDTITGHFGKPW